MSDFSCDSINIDNTPAENMKALQDGMWAEKQHNTQLSRQFRKDIKRRYNYFTEEHDRWEVHSAKLAEKIRRCGDFKDPVALRLAIVVINGRNRLLELKAEAEDAAKTFGVIKAKYQKSRKMYRQELGYLNKW